MELDDPRWLELDGGYRVRYDPRPAINRVCDGDANAWHELWEELHHQGDVGVASYAAVSILVAMAPSEFWRDWNLYALASTVEEARCSDKNPEVPTWLEVAYANAWDQLERQALTVFPTINSEEMIESVLTVLALRKGQSALAQFAQFSEDERRDMLVQISAG